MTIALGPRLGLLFNANIGEFYADQFRQFLQAIDQLVQMSVINSTASTPPSLPSPGDAYLLLAPNQSGAWTGFGGHVAVWDTQVTTAGTNVQVPAWVFYFPQPGWIVWNVATSSLIVYNGTTWSAIAGSNITLPVTVPNGGTGATTPSNARNNLSAASSGINNDITALNTITTDITTGGQAGVTVTSPGGNGTALTASNGINSVVLTTNGGVLPAYIQCIGNIQAGTLTLTGPTQTTIGSAGSATSLPGAPLGYLILTIDGQNVVMPFWAAA